MAQDINLALTAHRWKLAPELRQSVAHGGVLTIKNVTTYTYLDVTREQWAVLEKFSSLRSVPAVLQQIIEDRSCPRLGEFYELILKAVQAGILIDPAQPEHVQQVANWPRFFHPREVARPVVIFLVLALAALLVRPPPIPESWGAVFAGFGCWVVAWGVGLLFAASLLRGAGGEICVRPPFFVSLKDACMLLPADHRTVLLAPLMLMAVLAAVLAWYRPDYAFVPMLGLFGQLRPFFGGAVIRVLGTSMAHRLSDAEHDHVFPANRSARERSRLLRRGLRRGATWAQVGYSVLWTLGIAYAVGASAALPPWTLGFWREQGVAVGAALALSLALLGVFYVSSELFLWSRSHFLSTRERLRRTWRRWTAHKRLGIEAAERPRAVLRSPLLRQLPPPLQQRVAMSLQERMERPWRTLLDFEEVPQRISLIRSGKVGVYRRVAGGRRELMHVLAENDIVGLHAVADPQHPVFHYRTLTPVILLELPWSDAQDLVLQPLAGPAIANAVLKLPFLTALPLCRTWHVQAVQRFAELSRCVDFAEGDAIMTRGNFSDSFYILFEGEAVVVDARGQKVGQLAPGDFFGEIGLLQNGCATAHVRAGVGTRVLSIPRAEFFRFVTHNHSVALELERVSSARLGYPIFPLKAGNFETFARR